MLVLRERLVDCSFCFLQRLQRVQGCAIDFAAVQSIYSQFHFYLQRLKPKSLRHSDRARKKLIIGASSHAPPAPHCLGTGVWHVAFDAMFDSDLFLASPCFTPIQALGIELELARSRAYVAKPRWLNVMKMMSETSRLTLWNKIRTAGDPQ